MNRLASLVLAITLMAMLLTTGASAIFLTLTTEGGSAGRTTVTCETSTGVGYYGSTLYDRLTLTMTAFYANTITMFSGQMTHAPRVGNAVVTPAGNSGVNVNSWTVKVYPFLPGNTSQTNIAYLRAYSTEFGEVINYNIPATYY
jgi:hypothetical protein